MNWTIWRFCSTSSCPGAMIALEIRLSTAQAPKPKTSTARVSAASNRWRLGENGSRAAHAPPVPLVSHGKRATGGLAGPAPGPAAGEFAAGGAPAPCPRIALLLRVVLRKTSSIGPNAVTVPASSRNTKVTFQNGAWPMGHDDDGRAARPGVAGWPNFSARDPASSRSELGSSSTRSAGSP